MQREVCQKVSAVPFNQQQLFRTEDPEELQSAINRIMESRKISMKKVISGSSFTVNRVAFSEDQILGVVHTDRMAITSEKLESIHVVMPLSGGVTQRTRYTENVVAAGRGIVLSPGDKIDMEWHPKTTAISIRVPEATLRRYLMDYFKVIPYKSIGFVDTFEWTDTSARILRELLSRLCRQIGDPNSLFCRGLTTAAIEEELILTLIDTLPNNYSDALIGRPNEFRPKHVKRVIDFIIGNADCEILIEDLVSISEVSLRSLQNGFKRVYGIGPMTFLRRYKLSKVREVLQTSDPQNTVIGEVAAHWGFFHASNFAKNYRALFGEYPSDTLGSTSKQH